MGELSIDIVGIIRFVGKYFNFGYCWVDNLSDMMNHGCVLCQFYNVEVYFLVLD